MIKITPATLGREEMAWLWTALKADYRPTFPFQVSVVLMQPQQATTLALPVLQPQAQGAADAARADPAGACRRPGQIAAAPTDTVTVTGENPERVTQVSLSNARYGFNHTVRR